MPICENKEHNLLCTNTFWFWHLKFFYPVYRSIHWYHFLFYVRIILTTIVPQYNVISRTQCHTKMLLHAHVMLSNKQHVQYSRKSSNGGMKYRLVSELYRNARKSIQLLSSHADYKHKTEKTHLFVHKSRNLIFVCSLIML